MPDVIVHQKDSRIKLKAEAGQSLFMLLRDHGFQLYSPCGGKGTCGKCLVHIKGYGDITSCLFLVEDSIEVVMPDYKMARILTSQHTLTRELPLQPGSLISLCQHPYGIAMDIGTTTLVFYMVDLLSGKLLETRSMLNPQAAFGHDVISRIQYASNGEGLKKMQNVIVDAINSQIKLMLRHQGLTDDNLVKLVAAGNNTMLHLLLGVDPSSMGQAPYIPRFVETQVKSGRDAGLLCNAGAEITLLPSVSAFVGSDILAGLGSIREEKGRSNYLFVDLGTNGELALVTPDCIWCCATAAGPVFEGANISCGIGGVEGAISEFQEGSIRVIGDEKPAGICGSGLVDIIAHLLDRGIIDPTGFMQGNFEVVPPEESGTGHSVFITPEDVRQVQLAKSAIASGIILLMKRAGVDFGDIDCLFLAGGFGNYLNIDNAMKTGLLPPQVRGKVISLGNAAGTGALLALNAVTYLEILSSIIQKTRHIELSDDDDFPLQFAMNMGFQALTDHS